MPEMAGNMDSELLLNFIVYFSDYPLALLRMLLRFFRTTFVETAVYIPPSIREFIYIATFLSTNEM